MPNNSELRICRNCNGLRSRRSRSETYHMEGELPVPNATMDPSPQGDVARNPLNPDRDQAPNNNASDSERMMMILASQERAAPKERIIGNGPQKAPAHEGLFFKIFNGCGHSMLLITCILLVVFILLAHIYHAKSIEHIEGKISTMEKSYNILKRDFDSLNMNMTIIETKSMNPFEGSSLCGSMVKECAPQIVLYSAPMAVWTTLKFPFSLLSSSSSNTNNDSIPATDKLDLHVTGLNMSDTDIDNSLIL